jgi:hypothetical protein
MAGTAVNSHVVVLSSYTRRISNGIVHCTESKPTISAQSVYTMTV